MNKEDCFCFGKIVRTRGLKGELNIKEETAFPINYNEVESVFVELNNQLVPFFVDSLREKKTGLLHARLGEVDSIEKAQLLVGKALYLPLKMIPPTEENKLYSHKIIGFEVLDKHHGQLGKVEQVLDYPGNTVLRLSYKNKEVLIPVADEIIRKVDIENKTIEVETPAGLIELYLGG